MPNPDGVAATRQITKVGPQVAALVLSTTTTCTTRSVGARRYLLEGTAQDEVTRAIFDVAFGWAVFGPAVSSRLLARLTNAVSVPDAVHPQLTTR